MQHSSKLYLEMQHNSKLWTKAFITVYCVITPGASDDFLDDDDDDDCDDNDYGDDDIDDDADAADAADADHPYKQLVSLPCDSVSSHLVLTCIHDDILDLIIERGSKQI